MSLLGKISVQYSNMSTTEKKIADIILSDAQRAMNYTVSDMAFAAGVSRGSVVNFAVSMGFEGYSQMKIALAQESASQYAPKLSSQQSECTKIFQNVIDTAFSALCYTIDMMSENICKVAEELVKANKILIFAAAPSTYVAEDIGYNFMRIGLPVVFSSEPVVAALQAGTLTSNSVLLEVSEGGRTFTGLEVAKTAKNRGAHLICLTSTYDSPLYRISDIALVAVGKNLSEHMDACIARILYMLIGECICSYITSRIGDEAYRKLSHELAVIEKFRESR